MLRKAFLAVAAIALSTAAFAADPPKNISDGAAKGQATEGTAQPTGNTACKPMLGKPCPASAVNYNASKSNTGNVTAAPSKNHDSASPN